MCEVRVHDQKSFMSVKGERKMIRTLFGELGIRLLERGESLCGEGRLCINILGIR